ncbi:hypothetical protein [Microvirga sp. M2]|uniref:hypothetical protein n=1 Tax=Microvirga sp. M2 TaxID=3073270 RepID=UPI0039C1D424
MIDAGQIVIHADLSTLPETLGRGLPGVQAATALDGTIHPVATNLSPSTAQAVLWYEAFHSGTKALVGSQRWGELMDRLGSLYRRAELRHGAGTSPVASIDSACPSQRRAGPPFPGLVQSRWRSCHSETQEAIRSLTVHPIHPSRVSGYVER